MNNGQAAAWQRLEGLALLAAAVCFFLSLDVSPWWLMAGILVPDISMAGYLAGNKTGAYVYNLGHSLVLPLAVVVIADLAGSAGWLAAGLIWTAHIGLDRLFGFGLKLNSGFSHTHLGNIGRLKK